MHGNVCFYVIVTLTIFGGFVMVFYANQFRRFTMVEHRGWKRNVFLTGLNTTTNTTTKRSKTHETWWVPLREDTWMDLSQIRNVSRKPTNTTLVGARNTTIATKTILIYTAFFGSKPWSFAEPSWDGLATDSYNNKLNGYCPHFCRLTYDHEEFDQSHAVVFHGRDMPSVTELEKLNSRRRSTQRWIFYLRESPMNTHLDLKALNFMFNWTITYRLDSDIFQPDHYFRPLENETPPVERNYAEGKDRLVGWLVSNCGSSFIRNDIARKLLEFVHIDIYGSCQGRFGQSGHKCPMPYDSEECIHEMRRYKFYLALENSNCYHYVTEKYWESSLMRDIVPIVMGGAVLEEKLLIPRTYISILDFPNPASLAKYLKYLDKNDTAYNEFFWYKKHYRIYRPRIVCRLCKLLNDENKNKTKLTELYSYWNRDTNCYINESYIRNIWLKGTLKSSKKIA